MKKSFLPISCLLSATLFAMPVCAQTWQQAPTIPDNLDARAVQNLFEENKGYFTSVDYMLDGLLKIPEEKKQYFYPMLFDERIIPHKIISHPEILKYKGKKPTVIAPQLAEYAKKYLDDLPAAFYPYLDPEKWLSTREKIERAKKTSLANIDDLPLLPKGNAEPNPNYKAKSLSETYKLPQQFPKEYWISDLTSKDVFRAIQTMNAIPDFIMGIDDDLAGQMRDFLSPKMTIVLAWPFREWSNNFSQTPYADQLEPFLKSKGWANTQEFIDKSDTLLKAYRASTMRLNEAMVLSKFRKEYPVRENETFLPIQMMAEQYNAKAADALFVKQFALALKKAFKNQSLLRVGLPINLIK